MVTGKCEICGKTAELIIVSACACDENSPHALLCEKCKKKYFDYMCAGPFGVFSYLPSVTYIQNWSYAENLVYAYRTRFEKDAKSFCKFVDFLHQKDLYGTTKAENEEPTMKVEYNGFTGELVKLVRTLATVEVDVNMINATYQQAKTEFSYDLSIYDSENQVTHSFTGVKIEDMKFLGRAVSFGG